MKLKIVKKQIKNFRGEDGEEREYAWYIGKDAAGMAKRFGSTDTGHEVGDEPDVLLEEKVYKNGGTGLAEIVVDDEE